MDGSGPAHPGDRKATSSESPSSCCSGQPMRQHLSGLISRVQDVVVPLRLLTPPKPPNGLGSKDPPPQYRIPTPPRQLGILLPPTYAQATSASAPPIYKHQGLSEPQKMSGNNTTGNSTPKGSGTPLLNQFIVNTVLPDHRTAMPAQEELPTSKLGYIVNEFFRPEGLRRKSKYILGVCTVGIPLLLGAIAAIIYLSLRPRYPVVGIDSVKVWKFSAVGGVETGGENPVLNLDLDLRILVANPNRRLAINYQEIEMLVSFENTTFPIANLPTFSQRRKSSSVIATQVLAANAALQADDGALLQYDIAKNDIPLRAVIDVKACAKSGRWRTPSFRVHYVCDFRIAPPGKIPPPLGKSCKRSTKGIPAIYVTDQTLLD